MYVFSLNKKNAVFFSILWNAKICVKCVDGNSYWSSTLCELNISVNDLREEVVWSSTPFFFYTNTCKPWLIRLLSCGKTSVKILLCSCASYWFVATISKINEKNALHCNMHITKMLTDILQLFVWIKSLVCLAACFPLLKVMFACLFH